jgi:hypothetical protein
MSVTARTRRILWVKAGGRCSICHEQLVTDAEGDDDPSVFGEECHIVAQSPGGPRAADISDIDGYDNLILLCRKHHKQVDDQRSHFTVEGLKQIKREHEQREASRDASSPVRLIPDPAKPAPRLLKLCRTGEDLWQSLSGAYSFSPSYPARLNDDQAEAIDGLLDLLRDWLDIAAELSYKEQREICRGLTERIVQLTELGLLVGTRTRYLLLAGGSADPSEWRSFDIEFQPVAEAQLRTADGTPLVPEGPVHPADPDAAGRVRRDRDEVV